MAGYYRDNCLSAALIAICFRSESPGPEAHVSTQVLAAKDFDLLVGNYSRVGFHHPGPALIYVQAFGEWLFYDVLNLVPIPWNGQAIGILLFNAAMMALALGLIHDWYPSWTLTASLGGPRWFRSCRAEHAPVFECAPPTASEWSCW